MAMEEALRVIQTKSSEEAVKIFTEGLLPVEPIVEKKKEEEYGHMRVHEMGCSKHIIDAHRGSTLRDICTAPF